jgi:hypothetical protein
LFNIVPDNIVNEQEKVKKLLQPIVGPTGFGSKIRKCSKSFKPGRNSSKCPLGALAGVDTKDLIGGKYIIGLDPVTECGLPPKVYLANKTVVNKSKEEKLWLCFHKSIIQILSLVFLRGCNCFNAY